MRIATDREKQLMANIVGVLEHKPLKPLQLLAHYNPPPEYSDGEIQTALAMLIEARKVELTSDRYVRVIR